MTLDKNKIKNVAVWALFAAFFIIMLAIMHPTRLGS